MIESHCHIEKSYSKTIDNLHKLEEILQEKWVVLIEAIVNQIPDLNPITQYITKTAASLLLMFRFVVNN